MDLEKLTPAPWYVENEPTKIVVSSSEVQRIAWVFDENHAEFCALARNAFDVMMRRGWSAERGINVGEHPYDWHVKTDQGASIWFGDTLPWWPDPFTALVEADKWYRENVETNQ